MAQAYLVRAWGPNIPQLKMFLILHSIKFRPVSKTKLYLMLPGDHNVVSTVSSFFEQYMIRIDIAYSGTIDEIEQRLHDKDRYA